jgi:hypothetical protein
MRKLWCRLFHGRARRMNGFCWNGARKKWMIWCRECGDWRKIRPEPPSCLYSDPSPQQHAENDCENCPWEQRCGPTFLWERRP